jgi:hypothetical protein
LRKATCPDVRVSPSADTKSPCRIIVVCVAAACAAGMTETSAAAAIPAATPELMIFTVLLSMSRTPPIGRAPSKDVASPRAGGT